MDFKGQTLAAKLYKLIILSFALLGFIIGLIFQEIKLSLFIVTFGAIVAGIVVIPNWKMFNKMDIKWQPAEKNKKAQPRSIKDKVFKVLGFK